MRLRGFDIRGNQLYEERRFVARLSERSCTLIHQSKKLQVFFPGHCAVEWMSCACSCAGGCPDSRALRERERSIPGPGASIKPGWGGWRGEVGLKASRSLSGCLEFGGSKLLGYVD